VKRIRLGRVADKEVWDRGEIVEPNESRVKLGILGGHALT
jgi:hypothetical protein